jgi:hypothetical protein
MFPTIPSTKTPKEVGNAFSQFRKEGVEGHALLVNLQGFRTRQLVRGPSLKFGYSTYS